jgi:acyl-CoA thioesterase FadM
MGVVYHGNYAQYFEMDAWNSLETLGFHTKWMEESGVILPVIS